MKYVPGAHNFVLHGLISKLFGTNDHVKTMWLLQEPCRELESQGHSAHISYANKGTTIYQNYLQIPERL